MYIPHTGIYNDKLKYALQNALDRLPEGSEDNIEFYLFTTAAVNIESAINKIQNTVHSFAEESVSIFNDENIEKQIIESITSLQTVDYAKIQIDKAKNYLSYESKDTTGVMVNVSSTSITQLYNKYAGKGLFDLNIRKYIHNKLVDNGINNTLDSDRENFWFLNNGIIIACKDFDIDGNSINLERFSIVNGGQTTSLIGKYTGKNKDEFYIPCKIVAQKKPDDSIRFFTKIAEATNSQKPINARDLKSNSPEMLRLKHLLDDHLIYLDIKRGVKNQKSSKYSFVIKNDELGQIVMALVMQKPSTARNSKRSIFEVADNYNSIFKVNYDKDINRKDFLFDLIDLYQRFCAIETKFIGKDSNGFAMEYAEVLKNGRLIIFALLGVYYRLVNGDIDESQLRNDPKAIKDVGFTYGKFISNYHGDDLMRKLEVLIYSSIRLVSDAYGNAYRAGTVTSVSNYFKTDLKYYEGTLKFIMNSLPFGSIGEDIKSNWDILKR